MPYRQFSIFIGCLVLISGLWANHAHASDIPCGACHSQVADALLSSPHGSSPGSVSCINCHSNGQEHIAAPGAGKMERFESMPAGKQNSVCSSCHVKSHGPETNGHTLAGIKCTNCHTIHAHRAETTGTNKRAELSSKESGSAVCIECHQAQFTQFEFNERHRLTEGALTCISCHDPHSPGQGLLSAGLVQSPCEKCHSSVSGPFVFEHTASRLEGCTACHEPHGSQNRHMLKHQQVGALCYSCHAQVPQFHAGFAPGAAPRFNERTVCTNCHVAIHGSNLDRLFLR